ncbi:hypothetical protein LUW77_27995 [Streptomyces radiopugnans]|nr:hypothetical protein LUW77_27995 [Streptomyces radiopugnans]
MPDVAGAAVLGCCAGWVLLCAAGRDARPEGVLLAVLAVAAGYACGRIGGSLLPVATPAGAALAGLVSLLLSPVFPLPDPSATVPALAGRAPRRRWRCSRRARRAAPRGRPGARGRGGCCTHWSWRSRRRRW